MTRQLLKRAGALLSVLFFVSSSAFSQIDDFNFIRSSTADATKFLQAYMAPWTNAFGAGLNGGWYNTAKPHKPLGFDITTSINVGIVPESAGQFDISSLGMTKLSGSGTTPSISGPKASGPVLTYQEGGQTLASFNAPGGANWRYIPVPTLGVGIGLPLGSELKGRFIPKLNIRDGDISLWGVGLMHNLTQYLPGDKILPFDVSVFGGYTKLQGNIALSILPDASFPQNYNPPVSFAGQNMNVCITSMNYSAIASLNLPVITFYGGLGYSKTKTTLQLEGNFPTPVLVATPTPHVEYNNAGIKTSKDFSDIGIEDFSGLRANIGFRIKLAVITIHADYTKANYSVVSTGLGFSFR